MRRILGVNIGSKRFFEQFDAGCAELDIFYEKIRSRDCCIVLRQGEAVLYHLGKEVDLSDVSYAFIRVAGNYTLMTSLLARLLHSRRIEFNDRFHLEHTHGEEKITQMLRFTLAGIPIPDTVLFTLNGYAEHKEIILSQLSFPSVLKVNGSKGNAVWKIENTDELDERVKAIDKKHEVALLQEFIPNTYDIRALYFYGKCLGAMRRESVDGFHNNVSQGGKVAAVELTDEENDLALKACAAIERDFGGVDIVRTERGPLFFEINAGPQVYGFERATGIDVPKTMLERVKTRFLQ